MKAMIFAFDNKLGKNNGIVAINAQVADPPFDRFSARTVDDKLLFFNVVSCSRH